MRSSISRQKRELILRIASSRIKVLDGSVRLERELSAALPKRLALPTFARKKETPRCAPSAPSKGVLAPSKAAVAGRSIVIAAVTAGLSYVLWRFARVEMGQLLYRLSRLIVVTLKRCWSRVIWPAFMSGVKQGWRAVIKK